MLWAILNRYNGFFLLIIYQAGLIYLKKQDICVAFQNY